MDLFEKIAGKTSPLGQFAKDAHHYYTFPKLEGELAPHMMFRGKEVLNWSLNNYLGLGNHPEVRKADADAAAAWGCAYPMGARMMSGNTDYHEELERQLAEFEQKEDAILLNFGYQGILSAIDALVDRRDVIVYDAESHACIIDGVRLHQGKRFVYAHNDIENLERQLVRAKKMADQQDGAILVITEGVFGMSGNQGNLREIVELKSKFDFRLMVDDAHGFGTLGPNGEGAGVEQGIQDDIDIYFSTFAKSMASIGAFIAGDEVIINYLRYSMRSQIFAKSLPMPFVIGALKRLDMLKSQPQHKENLWKITNALQGALKKEGFDIGTTTSCVTPVILKGNIAEATHLTYDLRENFNIFCSIVVYPVVPKDVIMLRLIPTAVHKLEDVDRTIKAFQVVKKKLANGDYKAEKLAAFS
ncbi:MAG: 8-amino-7-oxononanoate synthase [Bacteroidetes bacterium]|nr:MAG: 8-amino-7-oxononanoate synthase [Bacteroidota bacterium]